MIIFIKIMCAAFAIFVTTMLLLATILILNYISYLLNFRLPKFLTIDLEKLDVYDRQCVEEQIKRNRD